MCLHVEQSVFNQLKNDVHDGQSGSMQGDRVSARKLGKCLGDSATPAQQLYKRCAAEWEANAMCHEYSPR